MTDTYEALAELTRSGDRDTIVRAAHQLGDSGDARAGAVLTALLVSTSDSGIRDAAAVGLRELHDQRALPALVELLQDPKTEGHRSSLVYALQGLDCRHILPFLVDLVINGNWEVSREAVMAIEETKGEIQPRTIEECLRKINLALPQASGDKTDMLRDLKDMFEQAE